MAEKEATVFIIDVGKSMARTEGGRNVSNLDWSLQWFWDRVTNIVSFGRKTLFVGVVALGSDVTNNEMSDDESYKNINVLQRLMPMTMPELKALPSQLKPSKTEHRDAISAIILAVDLIMRHCKHLQFKKKIYLVTNGTGAMDADDIESLVDQIQDHNIQLTVLGVDFDDVEYGFKEEDKSPIKAKNERLLKILVEKSGGVYGTMQEAVESLAIPNIKPVRPIPTYKGQLLLGDPVNYDTAITIDIERYFKVSIRRPPTASSFVVKTDQSQGDSSLAPVHSNRTYTISDPSVPQQEKTVDREELARGYQYGRTAVPISESDENITKLETISSYEILGFIPKENVERYMILENTNMLVAQKSNDKAAFALSSFIHALFEIDSCAIGRFVKKDMAEPQLTLITPYADDEIECLIENIIPFAEDLRQYRFPPVDKILTVSGKRLQSHRNLPDKQLMEAMSDFVDDMTITDDQMGIEDIYSPLLHSIEGAIRHRAVYPHGELHSVPEALLSFSKQPDDLQERSKGSLRDLIDAADVKKVPPKVKGRRKYRETEKPLSGLDIADLFRTEKRTKIAPDNAIPEFKQIMMMTADDNEIGDAVKQLEKIIEDQVRNGFGDSTYDLITEELAVMRSEMIEMETPDLWNTVIWNLKKKINAEELGGNRKELWWRIRLKKLCLISLLESTGGVSQEEADDFLTTK